jgi:hypothetical protein
MRQWMNDNPVIAISAVAVLLVGLLVWSMRPASSGFEQSYFWDMAAGELVVMPSATLPPAAAPSGNGQVVAAIVMACGSCADQAGHFVARLEKYTDEAKQLVEQMATNRPEDPEQARQIEQQIAAGRYIAKPLTGPGEPQWMSMMTPMAATMLSAPSSRCNGAAVEVCTP